MTTLPPAFTDLLVTQGSVVRLRDACHYVGRSRVQTQLRREAWQLPHRRVIVVHNGPLTARQQAWIAVLAAPDGSALSGLTAAQLDGLVGFPDPQVHVVVGPGQRLPEIVRVEGHRSHHLTDRDVHPARLPRRTRLARSVVDAASRVRRPTGTEDRVRSSWRASSSGS